MENPRSLTDIVYPGPAESQYFLHIFADLPPISPLVPPHQPHPASRSLFPKPPYPENPQTHFITTTLQNDPQQHQREATHRTFRVSRGGRRSPDSESVRRELSKTSFGSHVWSTKREQLRWGAPRRGHQREPGSGRVGFSVEGKNYGEPPIANRYHTRGSGQTSIPPSDLCRSSPHLTSRLPPKHQPHTASRSLFPKPPYPETPKLISE